MSADEPERADAVVVGAGFAGMYMLYRLRELGYRAVVFEAGRRRRRHVVLEPLPGRPLRRREPRLLLLVLARARAGVGLDRALRRRQPEILRYADHVADRFDLRRDIRFETRVRRARSSTRPSARWTVATDQGDEVSAPVLHHGGRLPLGAEATRRSPGLETFAGPTYHTGRWPHEGVDFTGQRVGRHRHRLVGHPVDPGHRRSRPATSPCSSARRTTACRRCNAPLTGRGPAGDEGRLPRPSAWPPATRAPAFPIDPPDEVGSGGRAKRSASAPTRRLGPGHAVLDRRRPTTT